MGTASETPYPEIEQNENGYEKQREDDLDKLIVEASHHKTYKGLCQRNIKRIIGVREKRREILEKIPGNSARKIKYLGLYAINGYCIIRLHRLYQCPEKYV